MATTAAFLIFREGSSYRHHHMRYQGPTHNFQLVNHFQLNGALTA